MEASAGTSRSPVSCKPGPCPCVKRRALRAYIQALPAGTVLLPGIAGIASITLFLARNGLVHGDPALAYAYGTLIAAGSWLLLPLLLRRYAYADRANPTAYAQLVERYSTLRLRAECLDTTNVCAVAEACGHLNYVGRELGLYDDCRRPPSGLRWLLGAGYIDVWRNLHRGEEALILADKIPQVIGDAVYDDLRLDGSTIGSANQLRMKLRAAVRVLDIKADGFLNPPPPGLKEEPVSASEDAARSVLQSVRKSINEFRDDKREGLVRARNNLYATVLFAGVIAYLLLGLAMLTRLWKSGGYQHVTRSAILAGAAFYLVGAVVGLFRQLRTASSVKSVSEEDFGLTTARLIHTPLFSGIAAVAGAALVRVLPNTLPPTGKEKLATITLDTVFNLGRWPEGLVFAAVFGLTPTLLVSSLQQRAEQFKQDLKSSQAGDQSSPPQ